MNNTDTAAMGFDAEAPRQGLVDVEIARTVRAALAAVNEALRDAAAAGLKIEVETNPVYEFSSRTPSYIVSVQLSRVVSV